MKRYSANVWETLIEALHIYWQVIKEKWPALFAVFVPLQLVMALYRYSVASSGAENLTNIRFENFVVTALGLTLGLVAVAIVVDSVFLKCTGQRRPSGGGIAATWGRMMATGFLRMLAEVAIIVVAIIALAIVLIFVSNAPLTQVGKSASAFSAIMACIILAPLAVAIVWILVRWSFSVVLSAIHPIMGSTAMGASSRFVRGRFACSLLMVVAAWLVMAGISAIPSLLASWYSRGEMVGLPAPSGTVLARTGVLFFGDLIASFGSLFMPVALTTFWVRTVEPSDLPESLRRGPMRSIVVTLLLLGVFSCSVSGLFGAKAAIRAKEERDQQRAEKNAEMIEAIKSRLREGSVVHPLPDAYKDEHMRMENGELVVDSPFDLCIGSSEAAKLLGAKLHSSTYDGTKQHYFAIARLSKPYFGCQTLSLNFYGEEKALGSVHLSNLKLPLDDCRKNVLDIAADISQRFGVKMEPATDETPEEALKRHERWRSSTDNSQYRISFIDCHTRMDNGQKTVSYEVEGMVDSQTKELSAELSIRAEDK